MCHSYVRRDRGGTVRYAGNGAARAVRRSQVRQRLYNLLNGDEGLAMWCGRVMTVLIIASLLPLCFKESSPILETIEYGCVLVFIIDYLSDGSRRT